MTTSVILCQGDKCPIRTYCLRYRAMLDPYEDISIYIFDVDNLWCEFFIQEGGDTESGKEEER